jgi:hypothetical protein
LPPIYCRGVCDGACRYVRLRYVQAAGQLERRADKSTCAWHQGLPWPPRHAGGNFGPVGGQPPSVRPDIGVFATSKLQDATQSAETFIARVIIGRRDRCLDSERRNTHVVARIEGCCGG